MGDLLFLAVLVGFFALAAGFVRACDRILATDASEPVQSVEPDERLAA